MRWRDLLFRAQNPRVQKAHLEAVLTAAIAPVEREWLPNFVVAPKMDELSPALRRILMELQTYRGFDCFYTSGRRLRYDFYVGAEGLIIEYDERQHFSLPRAITLEHYPPCRKFRFDVSAFLALCRDVRATDRRPPYRDEQRAFLDVCRDFAAVQAGLRIVRLPHGLLDFSAADATSKLAAYITEPSLIAPSDGAS